MTAREYVHKMPGDEGHDLPWSYLLLEEGRMINGGKEYVYAIGTVIAGCVCIGAGAVHFIHVPGYIVSLHKRMDSEMRPISIVDSITGDIDQGEIKKIFAEKYPKLQVCFL